MNQLIITGNLTADPVERTTTSGKRLATFTIAVNDRKDEPLFVSCAAWERTAEPILKYCHKGMKLALTGRVSAHGFIGKDGKPKAEIDLNVSSFEFLSPKPDRGDAYDDDVKYDPKSGLTAVADDGLPF